jgi:GH43 family beta-xylosidase
VPMIRVRRVVRFVRFGAPPRHNGSMTDTHFINPFAEGADPAVIRDGSRYLWAQSEGNRGVAIWVSDRPTTLGRKHVVWRAPEEGPYSRQVWAPELFHFDDRWYVYVAASDGDSHHHRAYVLESESADPLGEYTLHGPLETGDPDRSGSRSLRAIDMTVLEHQDRRYALWSGWPESEENLQDVYIAPMDSPTKLGGGRVRLIRSGTYAWEHVDDTPGSRALAEAPQVLQRSDRTFVVYSCGGSWLPSYKLGMLELTGSDPLDPASWHHFPEPVFSPTQATIGVGHSGFTTSPDGREWWHIFHAKRGPKPGWKRALYAQPMRWRSDGTPDFGQPVAAGAPVPIASGTPWQGMKDPRTWTFATDGQADFDYYGHHQYLSEEDSGLHLGVIPDTPVNAYRSGEKLVLRNGDYRDLRAVVDFDVRSGGHDVGLLFRVSRPAVGFDAQRGYFAGISTDRNSVVLGAMNGRTWREIGSAPVFLDGRDTQRITVTMTGPTINVYVGSDPLAALTATDTEHERGSVGLRVVDTHAVFHSMSVTPL